MPRRRSHRIPSKDPFAEAASFDSVLSTVGEFSLFQVVLYTLLCLPASFPSAFSAFNQVFVAAVPPHWCRVPELATFAGIANSQDLKMTLSVPQKEELKPYEGRVFIDSKCVHYDLNYTSLLSTGDWARLADGSLSIKDFVNRNARTTLVPTTTERADTSKNEQTDKVVDEHQQELDTLRQLWVTHVNESGIPLHEIKCEHGWEFDSTTYENTIVTEFHLYCEKDQLPVLSTTIFYIGSFIGNILFGYIGDKYGRRNAFFMILSLQIFVGTISAFSVNIYMFTVCRFFVGFAFPALYQIAFIIGMEFMGPPGRMFAGLVVCIFFGFSMCVLGFVANVVRDWQNLTLVSNVPFAILAVYWFFLPESPRWQVIAGRAEQAADILAKVATVNKRPADKAWLLEQCKSIAAQAESEKANAGDKYGIGDLFRTPNLRKKSIILTFVWLVNAAVYNGLTYNVSNLGVNDYFAFAINGAIEIPAYFLVWPLLNRVGRRWMLSVFMVLGGLACIFAIFIPPEYPWWISGMAFAGKFCNSASFAILYIFAGELYPTVLRALGMGFSSMIAGCGLITAPYLVYLAVYSRILPLLIMGIFTLAAGFASTFLPETLGSNLPQTLDDAEFYGQEAKYFSWRPIVNRPSIRPAPDGDELEQISLQRHHTDS